MGYNLFYGINKSLGDVMTVGAELSIEEKKALELERQRLWELQAQVQDAIKEAEKKDEKEQDKSKLSPMLKLAITYLALECRVSKEAVLNDPLLNIRNLDQEELKNFENLKATFEIDTIQMAEINSLEYNREGLSWLSNNQNQNLNDLLRLRPGNEGVQNLSGFPAGSIQTIGLHNTGILLSTNKVNAIVQPGNILKLAERTLLERLDKIDKRLNPTEQKEAVVQSKHQPSPGTIVNKGQLKEREQKEKEEEEEKAEKKKTVLPNPLNTSLNPIKSS